MTRHAICDSVESPLCDAAKAAVALLNATPLDHPERKACEALQGAVARALRLARELDWS